MATATVTDLIEKVDQCKQSIATALTFFADMSDEPLEGYATIISGIRTKFEQMIAMIENFKPGETVDYSDFPNVVEELTDALDDIKDALADKGYNMQNYDITEYAGLIEALVMGGASWIKENINGNQRTTYFNAMGANLENLFLNKTTITEAKVSCGSNTINLKSMFKGCTALTKIEVANIPNNADLSSMFENCSSLNSVKITIPQNAIVTNMFKNCGPLADEENVIDLTNATNLDYMFYQTTASNIKGIISPTGEFSANYLFGDYDNPTNLATIPTLNFGNCTSLNYAFGHSKITNLENLPQSLAKCNSLKYAFAECYYLTRINETNVFPNTPLVKSTSRLFNCYYNSGALTGTLIFPDLSSCEKAYNMFNHQRNITKVVLRKTGNLKNLTYMFYDCQNLQEIEIEDISSAINFDDYYTGEDYEYNWYQAFYGCNNLKILRMGGEYNRPYTTDSYFKIGGSALEELYLGTVNKQIAFTSTNILSNTLKKFYCEKMNYSQTFSANIEDITINDDLDVALTFASGLTSLAINGELKVNLNLSPCVNMTAAALDAFFTGLDQSTMSGITITITGCAGAATCDTSIATAKGYTVVNS